MEYFAKQIAPEFQQDDLFYNWKDNNGRYHVGINDDYIAESIIIDGNRDFYSFTNKAYDKLKQLNNLWYEWECVRNKNKSYSSFDNPTEFIEYYVNRDDGKKYSKKDIHTWILILDNWDDNEEDFVRGLKLITRKNWRPFTIRGCMQSEWQEGYACEDLSDKDIEYVEMCYFNTGSEYIVFENKEDFDNDENGCSYYVDSYKSKEALEDRLQGIVHVFEFDGYIKTPQYKEI